jgi:hypothetical protein
MNCYAEVINMYEFKDKCKDCDHRFWCDDATVTPPCFKPRETEQAPYYPILDHPIPKPYFDPAYGPIYTSTGAG